MAEETIHDGSSNLAKLKSGSGMGMVVEEGGEVKQDVSLSCSRLLSESCVG